MGKSGKRSRSRSRSPPRRDRDRRRSRSRTPERRDRKDDRKDDRGREKRRSPSSSSSSSSDRSRGKKEKKKKLSRSEKEEAKKQKALQKLFETPEQKRLRRLEKKAQKHGTKAETSYFGYNNTDNPWGDQNLTERFVWKKKDEVAPVKKEKVRPVDERVRLQEVSVEIAKVKRRREEREAEKLQFEEERERMERERANQSFVDWEKKEDQFHLKQTMVRAEVRMKEGRAKPIDILAKNLSLVNNPDQDLDDLANSFDIEIKEPYRIFDGMLVADLRETKKEIKGHADLDEANTEFWTDLMTVCDHELSRALGSNKNMDMAVEDEVDNVFRGKSSKELKVLEDQIKDMIETGRSVGGIDLEYWESLMLKVPVHSAKARLREAHTAMLRKRLRYMEMAAQRENRRVPGDLGDDDIDLADLADAPEEDLADLLAREAGALLGGPKAAPSDDEGPGGRAASPELISLDRVGPTDDLVDAEDDMVRLQTERKRILERERRKLLGSAVGAPKDSVTGEYLDPKLLAMAQEATAGEGEEEEEGARPNGAGVETFGDEVPIENQVYMWQDKYRPRKPRYFNRVHVGYEWNKYNQTHYDHDNPPPKVVMGYKFNVFFPDLVNKSKAPTFFIEKIPGADDFCMLRFHGGPPYEDIAFKIVNKEWEQSHRRGFKCTFDRGILQLFFNFKRFRYRR